MTASFDGWLPEFRENFEEDPRRAVLRGLYCAYLGAWYAVGSRFAPGLNIYERDWDALVVLDACRVDALREVADEYPSLDADGMESVPSVGCSSHEWMVSTFTGEYRGEIAETAHVTANRSAEPEAEVGEHLADVGST